jgi:hypothetical protein
MSKEKPRKRKVGRPVRSEVSTTDIIRKVILKYPTIKLTAVREIAVDMLPPDMAQIGIDPPLVHQTYRKLSSFFVREAVKNGLPLDRLINFLKVCDNWPSVRLAEDLASMCKGSETKTDTN